MDLTRKSIGTTENLSSPLTLQDILDRIVADEDLSKRKRQDLRSNIKAFATLLGLPLASSPADPHAYRRRLGTFQPRANGVGLKRWQNIRSDVQFALNRYRPKATTRGNLPMPVDAVYQGRICSIGAKS